MFFCFTFGLERYK
ncbi:hypothetical protein INT46_005650, partial [Mucor plumbeus]